MGAGTAATSGAAAGSMFGPWGTLIGAGLGLFGNLFGAHEQASGADKAAQLQAEAAKYVADVTAKAQADSLAFLQAQSENTFQNNEASRQGNYGQWAAQQGRVGSIGEALGYGPRSIPAYVPGVDPRFGGGSTVGAAIGGTPPTAPSVAPPAAMRPPTAPVSPYAQGTLGSYLPLPMTPALQMPSPYQQGSVGAYLR